VLKHVRLELVVVHHVDVVDADAENATPDHRAPAQRTAALGELLYSRLIIIIIIIIIIIMYSFIQKLSNAAHTKRKHKKKRNRTMVND